MSTGPCSYVSHHRMRAHPLFAGACLLARTNLEPEVVHHTNNIRSRQCATSAPISASQLTVFAQERVNPLLGKHPRGHAPQSLVHARGHLEYNEWSPPLEYLETDVLPVVWYVRILEWVPQSILICTKLICTLLAATTEQQIVCGQKEAAKYVPLVVCQEQGTLVQRAFDNRQRTYCHS